MTYITPWIHSFRLFLYRLFKPTTTQRCPTCLDAGDHQVQVF